MSAVTVQEVIDGLRSGVNERWELAERIRTHGIAPPEGMVLVPIEPTVEMLYSADEEACKRGLLSIALITYQAMLAAAPKQENE